MLLTAGFGQRLIPLTLSQPKPTIPVLGRPLVVQILQEGLERYGPRVWSSMIVKRLEDAYGTDLRAPGFPDILMDQEPEAAGAVVQVGAG